MKTILISLAILLVFLGIDQRTHASDCPKMELPTSFLGIFLTTTMLPIGTTIAAGRSSNTSGCGSSEPSDSFYRPKAARLKLFLEESGEPLAEEIAKGEVGPYLQVMTHLSECKQEGSPVIWSILEAISQITLTQTSDLKRQLKLSMRSQNPHPCVHSAKPNKSLLS